MQKLKIKKYLEIFDIKKVKIMNDIIGKKTIINLPEDFICCVKFLEIISRILCCRRT